MSFPTWPTDAFTDEVTDLTCAVLNVWRRWFTLAIDTSGGGTYVPSQVIQIGGAGIVIAGSTQRVGLTARLVSRYQSLAANSSSANWSLNSTTAVANWENTASGGTLWIELDNLPDGGTLFSVTLRFDAASGHANDPVTDGGTLIMPTVEVFAIDQDGGQTSLGSLSDTTVERASYEAAHDIVVTAINHTIDLTANRYLVEVTGETGADFQADAQVLSLRTDCIVTEYPEW